MRYLFLLVLSLGLVACDPGDAIDVNINPLQGVEDAVDGVQQGVDGLNDAVQNFGEGSGEGQNGGEEETDDNGNNDNEEDEEN